jgi:hypothetical protein
MTSVSFVPIPSRTIENRIDVFHRSWSTREKSIRVCEISLNQYDLDLSDGLALGGINCLLWQSGINCCASDFAV